MAGAKRKREKLPRLVACYWLDAAGSRDDQDIEPVDALTCGFLIGRLRREDGEEYLKIAGEIFADGGYRDVTTVPVGMVREIVSRPIKLPEPFDGWTAKDD